MTIEIMLKKQLTTDAEGLEPSHTIIVVEEFNECTTLREHLQYLEVTGKFKEVYKLLLDNIICIKIK